MPPEVTGPPVGSTWTAANRRRWGNCCDHWGCIHWRLKHASIRCRRRGLSCMGNRCSSLCPHTAPGSPSTHVLVDCLLAGYHCREAEILALENIVQQHRDGMRFHSESTSAILYQILDHIIDEDMAFTLRTRDAIDRLDELLDAGG